MNRVCERQENLRRYLTICRIRQGHRRDQAVGSDAQRWENKSGTQISSSDRIAPSQSPSEIARKVDRHFHTVTNAIVSQCPHRRARQCRRRPRRQWRRQRRPSTRASLSTDPGANSHQKSSGAVPPLHPRLPVWQSFYPPHTLPDAY